MSKFDDSVVREKRERERQAAAEAAQLRQQRQGQGQVGFIPGQDGVFYDPDHHAADYAGLVSRDKLERSHFSGKQQHHLQYGPLGVAPADTVPTTDYGGQGRRHFENDARFQSVEVVPGSAPLFADPTYFRPGGQDDRWQSAAMAANAREPTRAQFKGGQDQIGSRKHVVPAFERQASMGGDARHLAEITNGHRALAYGNGPTRPIGQDGYAAEHPRNEPGQLLGYRATAFKAGAPSMLASLGKAVVNGSSDDGEMGGFPDRPQRPGRESVMDARSREKGDFILDSSPGVVPGYTGARTRL